MLHVRKSGAFNLIILKWSMLCTCCVICDLHTCNVIYIQKLFFYFSCRLNFHLYVYNMQHHDCPEWEILIFKFRIVECREEKMEQSIRNICDVYGKCIEDGKCWNPYCWKPTSMSVLSYWGRQGISFSWQKIVNWLHRWTVKQDTWRFTWMVLA
jgi:hypothetical protein